MIGALEYSNCWFNLITMICLFGFTNQRVIQRCQSSGNFLISGTFSQMLLYKSIGKSAFSGNFQPFHDFLSTLTGISGLISIQWNLIIIYQKN